jgi:hypothetical protein
MELIIWTAFLVFALITIAFTLLIYNQSAYLTIFLFILGGVDLMVAGLSAITGFEIENGRNQTINYTYAPQNYTSYNATDAAESTITTNYLLNQTTQQDETIWKTVSDEYTWGINIILLFLGVGWVLFGINNLLQQRGLSPQN